jgi:extracellular factor (EF) 3-hydroxypalmitic acid methyl ester biosynthesis protein
MLPLVQQFGDPSTFSCQRGSSMNSHIAQFFADHVPKFTQELDQIDRKVDPAEQPLSESILDELTACVNDSLQVCRELEAQLSDEDPLVMKDAQARYREAILPWMGKSWIFHRSFTKPRGYPGDYQLLTAIYEGVAKSNGFGGYVDRFLLNLTLGRAVPARMWDARRFLMEEISRRRGRVAILNVACGCCREYRGGFETSPERTTTLTAVDNDQEALDYAKSEVSASLERSGIEANFVRYNALRMTSAAANIRRFGRSDIIYSVGLCDYIPDEYLVPLLKGWRESLADGGVVYVAFKDMLLYDKTEYQWLMDWYFFQRREEDFLRLFADAGYDVGQIEISRDAIGVIINFLYRDRAASVVRIDEAAHPGVAQQANSPDAARMVQEH